jgi:hypothetical protein
MGEIPGHDHQFVRILHRQEPQHDMIDQREDGGVRADPQGKRQDRNSRESRILP